MARIYWDSLSFATGVHQYPSRVEAGAQYARDMRNLRVDADGYLRLRNATRRFSKQGRGFTGVARSYNHWWFLREDGTLFYQLADDREDNKVQIVEGIENFSGRFWVVGEYNDFVILKSEGTDRGYWFDISENVDVKALGEYDGGMLIVIVNVHCAMYVIVYM